MSIFENISALFPFMCLVYIPLYNDDHVGTRRGRRVRTSTRLYGHRRGKP